MAGRPFSHAKAHRGEEEAWRWLVARSRGGESADPEVDPLADGPPPTGRERLETATKEEEEASEGLGRASRGFFSGFVLAIGEDLHGDGGKSSRIAASCSLQTLTVSLKDHQIRRIKTCETRLDKTRL